MNYRFLGYLSIALVVLVTAGWWLRKLNALTFKTKNKQFLNLLKFLRKLHKPLGILLVSVALWHGFAALGTVRPHTGLVAYFAFVLTGLLGVAFWLKKDKRAFKGHKVMAFISVVLLVLHLLWPGAIWQLFGV